MMTVRDVTGWLEDAYPPALAEPWDHVGLDCGDPAALVTTVGFAVDPTDAVVAEAVARGAQLLVTHHPLLFRGVHALRRDEPAGRLVIALLAGGVAHFCAHTNADAAEGGVNDALAAALGLTETRPLVATPDETPAVLDHTPLDSPRGIGRVGVLTEPVTAAVLARRLAAAVPKTVTGVRLGGDPRRLVRRVAVLGGAGDSHLDAARRAGVDAYVTGDLRHHPASDFLAHDDAPVLIDVPHAAAESLWLPHAERWVRERADAAGVRLETYVSTLRTDPWTLRVG